MLLPKSRPLRPHTGHRWNRTPNSRNCMVDLLRLQTQRERQGRRSEVYALHFQYLHVQLARLHNLLRESLQRTRLVFLSRANSHGFLNILSYQHDVQRKHYFAPSLATLRHCLAKCRILAYSRIRRIFNDYMVLGRDRLSRDSRAAFGQGLVCQK